jgi:hypothetical protein
MGVVSLGVTIDNPFFASRGTALRSVVMPGEQSP